MVRMLFVSLFLLLAVPAVAADGFGRLDADNDGKVTWEEFSAALPNMKKAAFETIDTDKDGVLTRAEWDAFASDHGRKMHEGQNAPAAPQGKSGALPLIEPPKK